MATPFPFPIPVTAAQVGTYFVGQYYQVLQSQPDFVHQFYSEASRMLRIDGNTRDTASGMLQIHALVMSLKYTGIEIKTAHSMESWNGGVLVMVSGSVEEKNFNGKRKFMQTFFLAPQEKGYFVLNDIFHYVDEEPILHYPSILLGRNNQDLQMNTGSIVEPVSSYLLDRQMQAEGFFVPSDLKENGTIENYDFPEQQLQQVPEPEDVLVEIDTDESINSLQNSLNPMEDRLPASSIEEPVGEPQKHTYASILLAAKAQSAPPVAPQPPANKSASQVIQQSVASSNAFEWSSGQTTEEVSALEDEDEVKSVYVRNLLTSTSEAEIEEEFRKFGTIKPDGVVIRSRKDVGVCYAFVEFEDMSGVQNAAKAGTALVSGRCVYIEERRPNSIPYRVGRGRGRGRGIYQTEGGRGRYGGRSGYDGGDYYRSSRGNGYHKQ